MRARAHPATVVVAPGDGTGFVLEDADVPDPVGDELLVAVDAVGMCHADLAARDGAFPVPLPAVLGHEGTGVVRSVGPGVRDIRPGDRVVLTFDACWRCPACRAGRPTLCGRYAELNWGAEPDGRRRMTTRSGLAFASFFGQSSFGSLALASERNAVVVPDDVPRELLAPLGCAAQTGVGAVLNVARPGMGDVVVVVGLGPVGFCALLAAVNFTPAADVVALDIDPDRLALAAELGATATVDVRSGDSADVVRRLGGASYVIECSGAPAAFPAALAAVRSGGTVVQVGAPAFGTTVPLDVAALVNSSATVRGSVEGDSRPHEVVPWLARMVHRGRLPLERLVRTYPLGEVDRAAEDMAAGRTVKPVLLP